MLKNFFVLLMGVAIAIALYWILFSSFQKKSMQLMKLVYIDKDYDGYRKLVNSFSCKLLLSKKQRFILNRAVYEGEGKEEELVDLFEKMHSMKLSNHEELDLYYSEIRFYIRKKDNNKILALYDEVLRKYQDNGSSYIRGVMKEIYYLIEIDYKGNVSLIDEVEKLYNKISIEQSKGIFAIRLFKLYRIKNDSENARKYYEKAIKHLGQELVDEMVDM